jgi:hypothetical protein
MSNSFHADGSAHAQVSVPQAVIEQLTGQA